MNLDRARAAQQILSEECVKEAFVQIEADIMRAWQAEKTPEAREQFWHDMSAIKRLRDKLKSFASDATMVKSKEPK